MCIITHLDSLFILWLKSGSRLSLAKAQGNMEETCNYLLNKAKTPRGPEGWTRQRQMPVVHASMSIQVKHRSLLGAEAISRVKSPAALDNEGQRGNSLALNV